MQKPDNAQYAKWITDQNRFAIGAEMLTLIRQIENASGYRKKRAKSRLHKLQQMSLRLLVKAGDAR